MICLVAVAFIHGFKAAKNSWNIIRQDAANHRSPNAGWPEAAMAGGLDIALSGPRIYEGESGYEPWINENGRKQIDHNEIKSALRIYTTSVMTLAIITGIYGIVF